MNKLRSQPFGMAPRLEIRVLLTSLCPGCERKNGLQNISAAPHCCRNPQRMFGAVKSKANAMSSVRHDQFSGGIPAFKHAGGLVAGTRVMTMDGDLPVDYLTPGDRILTRAGARVLAAVTVRVERDVDMVQIGTGTLGHHRPCADMLVPVHQMILIRDWRAQALYGAPQALVAAGRLADGSLIRTVAMAEARLFTLHFECDVVIYAGGMELACLRETVTA